MLEGSGGLGFKVLKLPPRIKIVGFFKLKTEALKR